MPFLNKHLTDVELRNTDRKLKKQKYFSNILKTEILWYRKEIMIFLHMLLNLKSKHIIKGAIGQIEKE